MPNYKEVEQLLAERKPFKHAHSMRAEYSGDTYEVYSYRTLIAKYDTAENTWWLNENKYSVTTSKQQSILRRVISRGTSPSPAYGELVFP